MHERRSGIGEKEVSAVRAEAQAMRIGRTAQYADGDGVLIQRVRALINQDAVRIMIANRDPIPVGADTKAIRQIEPLLEQDAALDDGTISTAIDHMAAHRVAIVIAHQ